MRSSGLRQLTHGDIRLNIVSGMAIGGMPAVLLAAFVVKQMPVSTLRWLVVVVVLYAAILLLRSATRTSEESARSADAAALP